MDSSWLAFSLSNNNNNNPISTTNITNNNSNSHLSLFHAFSTATSSAVSVKEDGEEAAIQAINGGQTNLSIYTTGPKLEDFLGGGGGGGGGGGLPSHADTQQNQQEQEANQLIFSNGSHSVATQSVTVSTDNNSHQIYDSDLKTIAASFLRGFTSQQTDSSSFKQPPPIIDSSSSAAAVTVPPKKAVETFGQRTSIYRGVTRHRWTGRYEAHLWDNSCRREGQSRKGRQVYLGGYDKEEKAARAYDLAALKYWGPTTTTNFPVSTYEKELEDMKNMTRQEFVASLRRKSSGFSRGASIYRGVTRHHQHGRWQARIGRVAGNKDLYLGTFSTQEEAAEAYDIAAIKFRGLNAVTNFDMSRYDVKSIANSNLPIGGATNKTKTSSDSPSNQSDDIDISSSSSSTLNFTTLPLTLPLPLSLPIKQDPSDYYWSNIFGYNTTNNIKSSNSSIGFTTPTLWNSTTTTTTATTTFQNPSSFNMEFMSNNGGGGTGSGGGGGGGSGYVNEQSSSTNSNSMTNGYEMMMMAGSNGSWIAQSLHNFESGKGNLSVFQTPIYGIE